MIGMPPRMGVPFVETTQLAHKQQRRFALPLEMSQMRAVKIHFGVAPGGVDFQPGQFPVAFGEQHPAGNFQGLLPLRRCHSGDSRRRTIAIGRRA